MKAGDWRLLIGGIAFVALVLFLAGVLPAHAAPCLDTIDLYAAQSTEDGWTWRPLGPVQGGRLTAFLLTAPDGSWQVILVGSERACLVIAGDAMPTDLCVAGNRPC